MTPRLPRRAITLLELMVAMAVITVVLGIIASLASFSFEDRAQQQARQRALEAAANVLETARSLPWDQLTESWAQQQKLSADPWLPDGDIEVRIETEANLASLKRVSVRVGWLAPANRPRLGIELVGFFAPRAPQPAGGKS